MANGPQHKVIIAGTGRAGTTVLVRLLTECGVDTGYDHRSWKRAYFEHCQAGLEHDLLDPDAPYVVKSPGLCETLPDVLATGRFVIDHALVPVRELDAAAQSRARVGGAFSSVPGGLWGTDDPARQKEILAELFHRLMVTLAQHAIPTTLLAFPRFVADADYAFDKLRFLLGDMSRADFAAVHRRVADPGLVHEFRPGPIRVDRTADSAPARAYGALLARNERRRRRRRTYRRLAGALGAVLLLSGSVAWHRAAAPTNRVPNPAAPQPAGHVSPLGPAVPAPKPALVLTAKA